MSLYKGIPEAIDLGERIQDEIEIRESWGHDARVTAVVLGVRYADGSESYHMIDRATGTRSGTLFGRDAPHKPMASGTRFTG